MKSGNTYVDVQKSLETAWNSYQKLFKQVQKSPSRKRTHEFRNSIQRLNAVLDLATRLQANQQVEKMRKELQEERKSLGPLRNAQVELQLLKGYEKDELYKYIQKRKSKAKRKAVKFLQSVSLKKQKNCVREFERVLLKKTDPTAAQEAARKLENEVEMQEKHFEKLLSEKSHFEPKNLHQMRIAAKQVLYQAQALKEITGQEKIDFKEFEEIHQLIGDVQNEAILLKVLDRYLSKKNHAKDQLAADLRVDLTEDQKRLMEDADRSFRRTHLHH